MHICAYDFLVIPKFIPFIEALLIEYKVNDFWLLTKIFRKDNSSPKLSLEKIIFHRLIIRWFLDCDQIYHHKEYSHVAFVNQKGDSTSEGAKY